MQTHCSKLSDAANDRLKELTEAGKVEFHYTTNPEDKPGGDRHVVIVRDKDGHSVSDKKLTTKEFELLLIGWHDSE